MKPQQDIVMTSPESNWVLADPGATYLVYLLNGGSVALDLSDDEKTYSAQWFNPVNGELTSTSNINGGSTVNFSAPNSNQGWALLLTATETVISPASALTGLSLIKLSK